MTTIVCATGNKVKFDIGQKQLQNFGITLTQMVIDIDEIQGEDIEAIIRDKARRAFEVVGQPVIVTDDSWTIPGLNGFPGPYMKSINHWLTPDDFIRLTRDLTNRRIYLNQLLAYQDAAETVVFRTDIPGVISTEARGTSGATANKVVVLDVDNGLTVSEIYDHGTEHAPERLAKTSGAWQELGKWLQAKNS